MEVFSKYSLPGEIPVEYELYQAASGDYCVSVSRYGMEREDYNLGSKEEALAFILEDYKVE